MSAEVNQMELAEHSVQQTVSMTRMDGKTFHIWVSMMLAISYSSG